MLLPILVDSDPGPGKPSVWTTAEKRNHLVPAVLLGVSTRMTLPMWGQPFPFHSTGLGFNLTFTPASPTATLRKWNP